MGRREKKTKNKNKGMRILVVILILLVIIAGVLLAMKVITDNKEDNENNIINLDSEEGRVEEEEEQIKIFSGTDRTIAIMIDNVGNARPQAGLNDAYSVYEIIVEGGATRLMALFKGTDLDVVGPVRSSRHYFLDYALENDSIYVHYGWSPQAKSDITTYSVNNINGISYTTASFWRVSDKSSPHNVMTSTSKILEIAESKGYKTTSTTKSVLNYTADEVDLTEGEEALKVTIPYSTSYTASYKYNEETRKV